MLPASPALLIFATGLLSSLCQLIFVTEIKVLPHTSC